MSLIGLTVDPNTYDITILRGDDQTVRFTVTTSTGAAQDVTNWSFKFTVKASRDDPIGSALFQKTTGGGGIALTTPASGIVDVTLSAADTVAMAGRYFYDLQGTDTGNLTKTVRLALFIVRKDVTNAGSVPAAGGSAAFPSWVSINGALYLYDSGLLQWMKLYALNGDMKWDGPSATIPF